MPALYKISITVTADSETDVRDLANAIREGIRNAQKSGRYDNVVIQTGPSIAWHRPAG